jgi:hypothetical protein
VFDLVRGRIQWKRADIPAIASELDAQGKLFYPSPTVQQHYTRKPPLSSSDARDMEYSRRTTALHCIGGVDGVVFRFSSNSLIFLGETETFYFSEELLVELCPPERS